MPAPAAVRSLRLVSARLRQIDGEPRRRSKALDRRIRSLELVLAACVAEAAFARRSESVDRGPAAPAASAHPDASMRGAWERPG